MKVLILGRVAEGTKIAAKLMREDCGGEVEAQAAAQSGSVTGGKKYDKR